MCYKKPGPRCSGHALETLNKAYHTWEKLSQDASTSNPEVLLEAMSTLKDAEKQYDMTPKGQKQLREIIANLKSEDHKNNLIEEYEERLKEGVRQRKAALQKIKVSEDQGDIISKHQNQDSESINMTLLHDETAPKLSIPLDGEIGRVYRLPGSEPLPVGPNGGIIFPSDEEVHDKLVSGEWVPSITNIVGVRNSPHLQQWSAKKALEEAIEVEKKFPGYIEKNRSKAIKYLKAAGDRDRDKAAKQGTAIHYACELLSNQKEIPQGLLTTMQHRYVDSYKKWLDDMQPEFIGTELTVFGSTEHGGYGGTTDILCRINGVNVAADIKTTRSGLHNDVGYQLSAVAHADYMTTDGENKVEMPKIEAAFGLHLSTARYNFAPVEIDGQVWNTFKSERGIWNLHAFHGKQDNKEVIIKQGIVDKNLVVATR